MGAPARICQPSSRFIGTAVRNFALLRKIAINRVGQDRSTKISLRGKRKKAAWDNDDMLQLLQANFMR